MLRIRYKRHGIVKRLIYSFWGRPLYSPRRKRMDIILEEKDRKLRQQQLDNKLRLEELKSKEFELSAEELEIKRSKIEYEKTRYERMKTEEQSKIRDDEEEEDEPEAAEPEDLAGSALNEVVKGVLRGINQRSKAGNHDDKVPARDTEGSSDRAEQEARSLLEQPQE